MNIINILNRLTCRTLAQIRTNKSPVLKSGTAGQMDRGPGWWSTSGKIGLPQIATVMGVGKQQPLHYNFTPS